MVVAMVPPLRGPTRHKTARKKKSGRSGRDDRKGQKEEGRLREAGRPYVLGLGVAGVGFYFFDLVGVAFAVGGD